MKKVSIITVTYDLIKSDREEFFKQMFESVQNQTYKNIEHVIIDGASKDGTAKLIQNLINESSNPNIKFKFISEPDTGIYNAMNKGIKNSTGDYIIIMNSDDYYYSNKALEILVNTLEKHNADFSCGSCQLLRMPKKKNKILKSHPYRFVLNHSIPHNTMLCKKGLFETMNNGGFDEQYKIASDYDFMFKTLASGSKYAITREVVTSFRVEGISCINKDEANNESYLVLKNNYSSYLSEEIIKNIFNRRAGISELIQIIKSNAPCIIKKYLIRNLLSIKHIKKYIRNLFK